MPEDTPCLATVLVSLSMHSFRKTSLHRHVFAHLRVLETILWSRHARVALSAFVCFDCSYTSGPFLPQTTFLHVFAAVGHKLHLKAGLCWISIKSCQYSFFTLHLSCDILKRGMLSTRSQPKRLCWEAFSPQLPYWAVIRGRSFLMGWRSCGTRWLMDAVGAARVLPWRSRVQLSLPGKH